MTSSRTPASQESVIPKAPHSRVEDALALLFGTFVVSFGVVLLKQSGTLIGGTAGLAFLLHYAFGISFGLFFFALNLPFYYLAFRRMGVEFVVKTFCAVALVSAFTELHPRFIGIARLEPLYATMLGCVIMGIGLVVLFRHKASLGGFNIVALYLQDRYGIRAGKVLMGLDFVILLASMFLVSIPLLLVSIAGVFVLNLIIAMNHRPHRYLA